MLFLKYLISNPLLIVPMNPPLLKTKGFIFQCLEQNVLKAFIIIIMSNQYIQHHEML